MKKTKPLYGFNSVALILALFMSLSTFAQKNQTNTNATKQPVVNQVATDQLVNPNEDYGYPWINYKGISDVQQAKQAWISDNSTAYQEMLPAATTANLASLQSADELNVANDALSIAYGYQVVGSLGNTSDANVGKFLGKLSATYSFTATSNFTRISTCNAGTDFDTDLSIYSSSNGSFVKVASNDDACGLNSEVYLTTTIGNTYYAVIQGFNNSSGNLVIEVFAPSNNPGTNPDIGTPCPLKVALVIDESGSISGQDVGFVKNGVTNFLTQLSGTGTQIAIVEFNQTARRVAINGSNSFQTINTQFLNGANAYLNGGGYTPGGATNWADAFQKVSDINNDNPGVFADLVLFFTDGDPNQFVTPGSTPITDAIGFANTVKSQGSHIFMLGVGNLNTNQINQLKLVSGNDQYPAFSLAQADFVLQANFAALPSQLSSLSTAFLTNFYADNDGDGFGAGAATNACDAPGVNYVTNNDDCDDADATVYPGAPDLCDGIANDCSDPNWPTPDVLDTDNDGDGLSECAGDCDDTDANVYPGAPEICDGKDNDCSGAIEDADCDGVEDACDLCPGGDDSVDADNDGLPDCAYPPDYADIDASWKCANNKVTICHVDEYGNRFELCVSKNAIAGHLGHGDFLGPCISCGGAKAINPNGNVLEELHVELFPVPANDILIVDINSAAYSNATISITDYLGRVVYEFDTDLASGSNVMEIDVSAYISGVYMLKVESENSIESVKLIVQ